MKTFESNGASPEFDRLTGMDSRSLVASVVAELRQHFGTEPPADLAADLLRRLLVFFALNGCWRARILRTSAPDFVRIFLRRWASELLFHRCRPLYDALPSSYRTGGALLPLHPLPSDYPIKSGVSLTTPIPGPRSPLENCSAQIMIVE